MSVTVGFTAATLPGLVTGGTTAASEDAGPEGLFATLLAMLGPAAAESEAATQPGDISAADFSALVHSLVPGARARPTPVPQRDPAAPETETPAPTGEVAATPPEAPVGGAQKPLLKDLGDALLALREALDAGKPVDPALERKLVEVVDAVAAALGLVIAPVAPAVDPRITALASGQGAIPKAPTPAAPAAEAPAAATPAPAVDGSGQSAPAAPTGIAPTEPAAVADTAPADEAPTTTTRPAGDTTRAETPPDLDIPPVLRQLGQLVGKLAERLEKQDPALAGRLAALAEGLQPAAAPLEEATSPDPELQRIIDALAAPKSGAKPAETPQFGAPALHLPEAGRPAGTREAPAIADGPAGEPVRPEPAPVAAKPAPAILAQSEPRAVDKPPTQATPVTPAETTAAAAPAPAQPAVPVARTIHAAYQAPVQQLNLPQLAFEVVRHFEAGNSRFQIRLDPPDLGRIDVRLEVDKSGTVNARMTVERPETLDLMQRDQRALQQALQQAGLDSARTNLEFSLRQNPFAAQGGMGDGRGQNQSPSGSNDGAPATDASAADAATHYRGTATAGGVNLFV